MITIRVEPRIRRLCETTGLFLYPFIRRLYYVFSRLRKDIQVIKDRDPAAKNVAEILLCYAGLYALFKKEIRYFFTSPIGLTIIGLFIVLNGLFLWVFKTDYNIFNAGFADMLPFFRLSSWVFVFLVPAITMRSISEEKKSGMLALLFTKPVSTLQMVLGKYLGILFLLFVILLPSALYVYMVWVLGNPVGNLDIAGTVGSYIALFLLVATFASVGLWASSISSNQIISFVLAAFLCFFFFFGIDQLIAFVAPEDFGGVGFQTHFDAISRGVLDTRNIVYFLSVISFFIYLTTLSLKAYKR